MTTSSPVGYIGPGLVLRGKFRGPTDMRIDGRLEGDWEVDGDGVVGEQAVVNAGVRSHSLTVHGHVTGNVAAEQWVAVRAGGRIDGDVRAARVVIDDGGIINGTIQMDFEIPMELEPGEEEQ